MNITGIKLWRLALSGLLILAILGLSIFGCVKYYLAYKDAQNTLSDAQASVRNYEIIVDHMKEIVTETKLSVVETQRKLDLSQEQAERLKQMNIRKAQVIGNLELTISAISDSLSIYRENEGGEQFFFQPEETPDGPMLPLPASFGEQNEWITQWAKISESGLGSIGFEMKPFDVELVLGSRGVFRKDYVSAASVASPYVDITANNFKIIEQKTKVTPILVSGVTGVLLGGALCLLLGGL